MATRIDCFKKDIRQIHGELVLLWLLVMKEISPYSNSKPLNTSGYWGKEGLGFYALFICPPSNCFTTL